MSGTNWNAIVIGGSAGSLKALSEMLPALPRNFPLPIMVVVHLPPDKKSMLAEVLQAKCSVEIKEAEDKEPVRPGVVYFAPPDYHLLVEAEGYLALSYDRPELFSRPSIDVLFESASDVYGEKLIAIILSGANNDGALGLKTVVEAGGMAIVQSPNGAYAATMPIAALAECPSAQILSTEQIANFFRTDF